MRNSGQAIAVPAGTAPTALIVALLESTNCRFVDYKY